MSREKIAPFFTAANAWAIVFVLWSALVLLLNAGWIIIPAKQTELEAVSRQLEQLKVESKETRDAVSRLDSKLEQLNQRLSPTKPASLGPLNQNADYN